MNVQISTSFGDVTFAAFYSRWRRRWIGRCTCGATLKPIFTNRDDPSTVMFFMEIHACVSHGAAPPLTTK